MKFNLKKDIIRMESLPQEEEKKAPQVEEVKGAGAALPSGDTDPVLFNI